MYVGTPGNGFYNYGGFGGSNIWASGGNNAPFDQPVSLSEVKVSLVVENANNVCYNWSKALVFQNFKILYKVDLIMIAERIFFRTNLRS